jgi:hypothetical protein
MHSGDGFSMVASPGSVMSGVSRSVGREDDRLEHGGAARTELGGGEVDDHVLVGVGEGRGACDSAVFADDSSAARP